MRQTQNFFAAAYLPQQRENYSLQDFDEAFHRWQNEKSPRYTNDQVIQVLGAYLGMKMARELDMEWVIVPDQDGTDYAVRSTKVEMMQFPFSSVSKRVDNHGVDFMAGIYETVKHTMSGSDIKKR